MDNDSLILNILGLFIIPFIIPSIVAGFIFAIFIYKCTKTRKTALIGFISGTMSILIINLLVILGLARQWLWLYDSLFEFWYLGDFDFLYPAPIPFIITPSLLLSTVIIFMIIMLKTRKVSSDINGRRK